MSWCFKMSLQLPKGYLNFVEQWPLMDPNDLAFIIITYFVFVFKVGPMLMEKRTPFQIKGFLIFYNAIKVMNSTFLSYKFLSYIMETGLFPKKCDYDKRTLYIIAVLYWRYMVTKIFDLIDTVFFVIRKKSSQVTFLHVYHHVFMVIMTWSSLKYDPSDHWAFMAVVNCIIHAIMYIYYGISALGPNYVKYIWWKRYLTVLQLIQFVLVIGHIIIQTYTTECPMGAGTYWVGLANLALFICLFTDFYSKRYTIDLAVYETLKKKYINKYQAHNEQPGMLLLLACGSTSCTLGQVCSYPLALVRTRLQAQEKAAKGAEGTMRGAFREIVQREGLRGLYRGITPNFIKVIPAVSISYVVYEYASRSLGVNMT